MPEPRAASGSGAGADLTAALDAALRSVEAGLGEGPPPDLVVVFLGGAHAEEAARAAATLRERLAPRHLLGTTAGGVVSDGVELERADGLSVWAARLPGADLVPLRYAPAGSEGAAWREPPAGARALVLLADPFSFPADAFLTWVEHCAPGLPVSGGLASGGRVAGSNRLLLDGDVFAAGAVGVAVGGDVAVRTLVSQGCRPIGRSFVVTRAERNLVQELGGAPPVERIKETFVASSQQDRNLLRQGLHIGLLIDEYVHEPARGDFLVRGVMGAETGTGALAVGDVVRVGQTVQFHVRDAQSADEDLRALLAELEASGADAEPAGALLFTCNGRGSRLFGQPDHDADAVREALGGVPVGGFFCAGEIGPVGDRSFLHGFTASLLVFDRGQA
jgi:small ligand-binding sensory domain FIST